MLTKEKIKTTFDSLPDKFTIKDIVEKLVILDKIEQGLNDVKKGKVYSTEEVKRKLDKWLK